MDMHEPVISRNGEAQNSARVVQISPGELENMAGENFGPQMRLISLQEALHARNEAVLLQETTARLFWALDDFVERYSRKPAERGFHVKHRDLPETAQVTDILQVCAEGADRTKEILLGNRTYHGRQDILVYASGLRGLVQNLRAMLKFAGCEDGVREDQLPLLVDHFVSLKAVLVQPMDELKTLSARAPLQKTA